MKNKILFVSLMILPAILFFLEIVFQHSRGEYYLYFNYDGPYGYLLASLNIAELQRPGYIQHPGIVPQIIVATVIKLSHLLQGNEPSIVMDTFNRPEFYFSRVNIAFAFLTSLGLFFLGKITYEKLGNITSAIFIQFTPFISVLLIYYISCNTVYACLMILVFILLSIVICFLNENTMTKQKNLLYIILFGINSGLLLATLISALPILIIPLLLIKKITQKLYFVLTAVITFFILFFSISSGSSMFWGFIINNMIKSGKYGAGPSNFIDIDRIVPSLGNIFNGSTFFCIIYLLILTILILQFIPRFKSQIRSNKYFLLLVGIIIIMSSYILLVIKQIEGYYILPGIMFSVIALFAINSIVSDLFPKFFRFNKYIYIFLIFIIFSIPQVKTYKNNVKFFTARKYESHKIIKYLKENYQQELIVSSDQTASMPTAFYNALNYTGGQKNNYISILNKKYPNYIYFQRYAKDFIYLDYNKELKNKFINSDTLIFHAFNEQNLNDFKIKLAEYTKKTNITYNEVFSNKNGEKVFLVTLK